MADFTLVDIGTGKETKVNLPQGCATGALWSADGSQFAFQNAVDTSVQLWVGDAATGRVKQVPNVQLNPIFGSTVQWLGGTRNLLVKLVPANQGPAPSNGGVPTGPDAQESLGSSGESSTYEARDTLTSVHDESCSPTTLRRSWPWSIPPPTACVRSASRHCSTRSVPHPMACTC